MPEAKRGNIQNMLSVIDHIYDLDHNGGRLLDKGGMYVDKHDLDRRSRIRELSTFIPSVSPLIKRLILRVLPYVSKNPEMAKNIKQVRNSPTKPFTPEEEKTYHIQICKVGSRK